MPPILVIDDDGPARAARSELLRRDGAVCGPTARPEANARYEAMIADTCMLDTDSTTRIRALLQSSPSAQFVARSRSGVMAPIHDAPDFQAMADRLASK